MCLGAWSCPKEDDDGKWKDLAQAQRRNINCVKDPSVLLRAENKWAGVIKTRLNTGQVKLVKTVKHFETLVPLEPRVLPQRRHLAAAGDL